MKNAARVSRLRGRVLLVLLTLGLAPWLAGQAASDRPASASTDRPSSTDRDGASARARLGGPGVSVPGLGDVPVGETLTIVYQVSVDAGPFAAGKHNLSSQGTVSGTNVANTLTDDPAFPGAADPTLTVLDAAPDLSITNGDGGVSTVPGGTVVYNMTISNTGNQSTTGVLVSEVVPANTTFNAGASLPGWVCLPDINPGSTCTFDIGNFAAGQVNALFIAFTVSDPVPAGVAQIASTASISDGGVNGSDPTPGNNSATDVTPLVAQPDLAMSKSDGGASVAPGGTVSYTLTYSNVGNQGGTGVVLSESVPANTTFNPGASTAGWACVPDNNSGSTCSLTIAGELAGGGASGNATFAVTVASPVPAGVAQVSNTASAADDGANGPDPNGANNSGSDTTPIDAAPDLSLSKSDGGASAVPGATVAYTLSYQNVGNQGGTGVVLTETVPADTTFNPGASTAGWVCVPNNNAGSACTLAIGAVPAAGPGSSGTATFAVTVVNPVAAGLTQISNSSSVADDGGNGPDPNGANNSGSDTTPVTAEPDLTIVKSDGGASVTPGGTVAYTLSYANAGNQGATGVTLAETVPANTAFNPGASTAGWACVPDNSAGSACTLPVGGLNGGGAAGNAAFAVTALNPAPSGVTQISNTSSVADDAGNGPDPTPANNTSSDTTPLDAAPDLGLTKDDGGASTSPGGTVSYTLSYTNVGNQDGTGVVLTETVPADTSFNPGASTAGWACVPDNNAGSTCTLAVGALAGAGGTGNATFAVTVVDPVPSGVTQISNTASAADDGANGPDPNGANNTGSDTTPLTAVPDLTLTKDDGGATVGTGGTVVYTLSYANAGSQAAAGVTLSETVPANTTFNAGASTAGWVCVPDNNAGSTCSLPVGALGGGGGSGSASFAVDVAATVPSGVTQVSNTASAADDGSNGPDPTPANNTGSDTTPLTAVPDLSLSLTDNRIAAHAGQVLTYVLSYGNGGSQDAIGVVLGDVVPLGTTFFDPPGTSGWSCAHQAPAGTNCTFNVAGTLVAGAPPQTTNFRVRVDNPTQLGVAILNNTASVADDGSNGPDSNPGNNSASDTNTITTPKGDLNLPGPPAPPPAGLLATAIARTDILFQNDTSNRLVAWFMDYDAGNSQAVRGGGDFTTPMNHADAGFRVVGVDDFNDDGLNDLLFRHNADGRLQVWLMNGMTRQAGGEVTPSPAALAGASWQAGGTGDLNEDGQADFIWYNTSSARISVWLMNGINRVSGQFTSPDTMASSAWRVVGAGHFNLATDAFLDLLLQNPTTGAIEVWLMDGSLARIGGSVPTTPAAVPPGWQVVAVGDYNVDSQTDILLRNNTSGKFVTWFMNGTTRLLGNFTNPDSAPGSPGASGLAWRIVGPK